MKRFAVIALMLIVLAGLGGLYVYRFVYNKPHPDYENAKAEHVLAAFDLYNRYKTNKAESDRQYTGKVLEVTGIIGKTEQTDNLMIIIFVLNEGMFGPEGVRCVLLPSQFEKAKRLDSGKEVKIKGYCTGFNDSDVIIEKCSFSNQ